MTREPIAVPSGSSSPTPSATLRDHLQRGVNRLLYGEREHEVLVLIAQGYTNTAIAERLSLSPKTVRNYVSSIFSKLQVADRTEAVLRARNAGLG